MRIVMIGNCQMTAMMNLYKRFAEKSIGQEVGFIPSYEDISSADRRAVENADIIIEQLVTLRATDQLARIETKAERIAVPLVNCGFLWPFAGQAHPKDPGRGSGGVYVAEMSDGYLNRLMKNHDADDAVAKYLALDVNKMVGLDRLLEVNIERQRGRDSESGFDIAPVIEEFFRTEQIFLSPHHPGVRVSVALAEQMFVRLGVDRRDIVRMQRTLRVSPFPTDELPIHPAVAAHFGLKWAPPDRRYRFRREGLFTFPQFARRYFVAEWNAALDAGLGAAARGKPCLDLLKTGLEISPDSAAGQSAYGGALEREGRWQEALPFVARAVELQPEEPNFRLQWGLLLYRNGEDHLAERQLRLAAALDPFWPHFTTMLAHRLRLAGSPEEAAAVARQGLVNSPYAVQLHLELGRALVTLADPAGASACFNAVLTLDQTNFDASRELSLIREQQGSFAEAADLMRRAVGLRPHDIFAQVRLASLIDKSGAGESTTIWRELRDKPVSSVVASNQLAHALKHAGRLEDAVSVARQGLARYPDSLALGTMLSGLLDEAGSPEEALDVAVALRAAYPSETPLLLRCSDILARLGRHAEAEQLLSAAAERDPRNVHVLRLLAHVLSRQSRHADAVAARKRLVALEPNDVQHRSELGRALGAAGRYEEAACEFRRVLVRDPNAGAAYRDLSHVLACSGQLEDAIENGRRAVALNPQSAWFQNHLGHLLCLAKSFEQAKSAFEASLAVDPTNVNTYLKLSQIGMWLGQLEEARSIALEALRRFPNSTAAKDMVGRMEAEAA